MQTDHTLGESLLSLPTLPYGWYWEGRNLVYRGDKTEQWARVLAALAQFEP